MRPEQRVGVGVGARRRNVRCTVHAERTLSFGMELGEFHEPAGLRPGLDTRKDQTLTAVVQQPGDEMLLQGGKAHHGRDTGEMTIMHGFHQFPHVEIGVLGIHVQVVKTSLCKSLHHGMVRGLSSTSR